MRRTFSQMDFAEIMGVMPCTTDDWIDQGMPVISPDEDSRAAADPEDPCRFHVSRRELASFLKVHADTISRWLPDGLGAAVVDRRRKNEPVFDLRLAMRWWLAREDRLSETVLEDFRSCAARGIPALHTFSLFYGLMGEEAAS